MIINYFLRRTNLVVVAWWGVKPGDVRDHFSLTCDVIKEEVRLWGQWCGGHDVKHEMTWDDFYVIIVSKVIIWKRLWNHKSLLDINSKYRVVHGIKTKLEFEWNLSRIWVKFYIIYGDLNLHTIWVFRAILYWGGPGHYRNCDKG